MHCKSLAFKEKSYAGHVGKKKQQHLISYHFLKHPPVPHCGITSLRPQRCGVGLSTLCWMFHTIMLILYAQNAKQASLLCYTAMNPKISKINYWISVMVAHRFITSINKNRQKTVQIQINLFFFIFCAYFGATNPFISLQCWHSKPSNFVTLLVFLASKTC